MGESALAIGIVLLTAAVMGYRFFKNARTGGGCDGCKGCELGQKLVTKRSKETGGCPKSDDFDSKSA